MDAPHAPLSHWSLIITSTICDLAEPGRHAPSTLTPTPALPLHGCTKEGITQLATWCATQAVNTLPPGEGRPESAAVRAPMILATLTDFVPLNFRDAKALRTHATIDTSTRSGRVAYFALCAAFNAVQVAAAAHMNTRPATTLTDLAENTVSAIREASPLLRRRTRLHDLRVNTYNTYLSLPSSDEQRPPFPYATYTTHTWSPETRERPE